MLYDTFSIISVLQTYMSQYVYNNKPDLKEMLKASFLYRKPAKGNVCI